MKQKHYNTIIEFLGCMVPNSDPTPAEIQSVNNMAVKAGYAIHPKICNSIIRKWLDQVRYNPNSTFYRKWRDITDSSRMKLFLDQLIHYASTYGTDFEAETYCPNGDPIEIDYQLYKVIEAVTDEELEKKIMDLLSSGIALKSEVVEAFCEWLMLLPQAIDLDAIKNREAIVYICSHLGIFPTNPEMLVRYIFYITTNNPMLIQSPEMLDLIRYKSHLVDLSVLTREQMIGLASVFNRYKRIFMALKDNRNNVNIVNKISRLSKKYHKPFHVGYWENITNMEHIDWKLLDKKVAELTNPFKVIKLLEMIKLRKIQAEQCLERSFLIRNGKIWHDKDAMVPYPTDFEAIGRRLLEHLIVLISQVRPKYDGRKTRIKLPNCTLVCPSSEKRFVGNLPMGSYYDLKDKDNYFGIYWRNEWGTHDFDLSFIHDGRKIGWNARYVEKHDEEFSCVFSGDMTNADPEATEMLYFGGEAPDGTIYVNRYSGEPGSQYKLFFGQDKCEGFGKNYMVDPNSIVLEDMMVSDIREQMVGQVIDNRIYFLNLGTCNKAISTASNTDFIKAQCLAHLEMVPILETAGYEIVDKNPDIDLSVPSKEKIIKLFVGS